MKLLDIVRLAPFTFLVLLASCQKGNQPDPDTNKGGKPNVERQESNVTEEEIKTYLDGKSLELPADAVGAKPGAEKAAHALVIKKTGIRALRIGDGFSFNNGPWNHDITFLYDTGSESYAVEGTVEHRLVGDQQAFFGFTVKRIVKQ